MDGRLWGPKPAGLEVIATASRPESRAWWLQLGASHVVHE